MAAQASAMALAITGLGMVSPLGLDASTSCAAARAGLNRAAPLPGFQLYSEGSWGHVGVAGHALREFAGGFEGFGKFVRLGSGALQDLIRSAALQNGDWARTALCVALPSGYFESEHARAPDITLENPAAAAELHETLKNSLLNRLCDLCSLPIPSAHRVMLFEDQVGFARGLQYAAQLLSRGEVDRCIVGGIDACTESTYLAAAHYFNALKSEAQPMGFQPGEAAAFLLLEPATARSDRVQGYIRAAAVSTEAVTRCSRKPALGMGLAECIDACVEVSSRNPAAPGWAIADLNGDAYRANDWGYALVRLVGKHAWLGSAPLTTPAESFGETGAAHGPIAACMAVRAFARRYAPARDALVWLSSYAGGRGAFLVSPAA